MFRRTAAVAGRAAAARATVTVSARLLTLGAAMIAVCMLLSALVAAPNAEAKRSSACGTTHAAAGAPFDKPPGRGVTIAFLPGPTRSAQPILLEELERVPGLALGLLGPSLGRYSPVQMMLDIGQGARLASSRYKPARTSLPALVLDPLTGDFRLRDWSRIDRRARRAPGEIQTGLLAEEVRAAGGSVAYVGADGDSHVAAVSVADSRCGTPGVVLLGTVAGLPARTLDAQAAHALVAVSLPAGGVGVGMLRTILAEAPSRYVVVVQAPPDPARTRLLAVAARDPDRPRSASLTSGTTRRTGLVIAPDITATVLGELGIEPRRALQGRRFDRGEPRTAEQLIETADRYSLVAGRRVPLALGGIFSFLVICLAIVALTALIDGRNGAIAGARGAIRILALATLWTPSLLLLTAALRPTGQVELQIVVGGSALLSVVNDRLIRWPIAPLLPALTVIAVHLGDFAFNASVLTGQSLLGPNPYYGARFFGVGNELEAVLVISGLVGAGALLASSPGRLLPRATAVLGVFGAALAFAIGWGKLGADVGGVIMVAAGFGAAVAAALPGRFTWRRAAAVAAAPVVGVAGLFALDLLTGGDAHLTRTVVDGGGGETAALEIARRRFAASIEGARQGHTLYYMAGALALLAYGWRRRERLLAPLAAAAGDGPARAYRAALTGALVATIVGSLANDSGPAILLISTVFLVAGASYVACRDEASAARIEP